MAGELDTIVDRPAVASPSNEPEPTEPEAETPEAEEPEDVNARESEGEKPGEADPEAAESGESLEDDLEDFEYEGKTYKGPKGLKDRLMMHGDYTRKTQEVAERRKELESFEQRLRQQAEATDEEVEARSQVWAYNSAIKQYENIDWAAWAQQDPVEAQQARYQYDDLRQRLADAKETLKGASQKRSQAAQQDLAKRVGETREYAQKNIKGFSPEVEHKVVKFALDSGLTEAQLQASMNPVVFDLLHKAMIGAEVINKPAAPPRKVSAPLKTVSSRSNAPVGKDLSDMSMDEYVAARKKQGVFNRQ